MMEMRVVERPLVGSAACRSVFTVIGRSGGGGGRGGDGVVGGNGGRRLEARVSTDVTKRGKDGVERNAEAAVALASPVVSMAIAASAEDAVV